MNYHTILLDALKYAEVSRRTITSGPHLGDEALFVDGELIAGRFEVEPDWTSGTVLEERLATDVELVICGGGHVALELATMALRLGYRTTVIDEREEYCNSDRFPGAVCLCAPFEQVLSRKQEWIRPYFVITTRGHKFDRLCLSQILKLPHRYIGMIGSRAKVAQTFDALVAEGFDRTLLQEVNAPIGLPLGGVTAAEIAVSILAQIIQVSRQRQGTIQLERTMLSKLAGLEEKFVLARVLEKHGSAPCDQGFQIAVFEDGRTLGTVGGGAVEARVIEQSLAMLLHKGHDRILGYDLSNTDAAKLGMICGGSVTVLFQRW